MGRYISEDPIFTNDVSALFCLDEGVSVEMTGQTTTTCIDDLHCYEAFSEVSEVMHS